MITDRKHLVEIAKREELEWHRGRVTPPRGLVMAILFAYIHRVTTGETVEETFFKGKPIQPDYEI